MSALVTLKQAKDRLRVTAEDEDDDILSMIEQASNAVILRVDNADITDEWDEDDQDTVPAQAQAAVLEMILFLYERDTVVNQRPDTQGHLPPRVEMLLARYTGPALA